MNVLTKDVGGPTLPIVRYFEIVCACVRVCRQTEMDGWMDGWIDGQTDPRMCQNNNTLPYIHV